MQVSIVPEPPETPFGDATRLPSPPVVGSGALGWPPICTLAELARILTLVHGVRAPTESSLKKWSAAGVFRSCVVTESEVQAPDAPSSLVRQALQRPSRAGRRGLRLRTSLAIAKVYERWPFLADSDPQAMVELVVARTADHLRSAIIQAAPLSTGSPSAPAVATAPRTDESAAALQGMERQIAQLSQEMAAVKREMAQFSALRNNLITKLDEAVARVKDALGGAPSAGGVDPLVEARRDRDMGMMKSTLSEIQAALQRIENGAGR